MEGIAHMTATGITQWQCWCSSSVLAFDQYTVDGRVTSRPPEVLPRWANVISFGNYPSAEWGKGRKAGASKISKMSLSNKLTLDKVDVKGKRVIMRWVPIKWLRRANGKGIIPSLATIFATVIRNKIATELPANSLRGFHTSWFTPLVRFVWAGVNTTRTREPR